MSKRKKNTSELQAEWATPITKPSTARELLDPIRKSGLIGMWKDRDDIKDSGEFARNLRKRGSKREGNNASAR